MVSSLKRKVMLMFVCHAQVFTLNSHLYITLTFVHHDGICTSCSRLYITLVIVPLMDKKLNFIKKMRYTCHLSHIPPLLTNSIELN